MTFRPSPSDGLPPADLELPLEVSAPARDELARLAVDGRITPEAVVAAARPKNSALHRYFEWRDKDAAHQFRLAQARALLRSIRVEIVTDRRTLVIPRYTRDPARGDEQGYISHDALRTDPGNARALVLYEFARAAGNLRRAQDIADSLGVDLGVGPQVSRLLRILDRIRQAVGTAPVAS